VRDTDLLVDPPSFKRILYFMSGLGSWVFTGLSHRIKSPGKYSYILYAIKVQKCECHCISRAPTFWYFQNGSRLYKGLFGLRISILNPLSANDQPKFPKQTAIFAASSERTPVQNVCERQPQCYASILQSPIEMQWPAKVNARVIIPHQCPYRSHWYPRLPHHPYCSPHHLTLPQLASSSFLGVGL